MGKKYIIILMQVLTSICMLSVGFASWTIVSGASLTAEGEIKAENVESNDRYIQMISCCFELKHYLLHDMHLT